MIPCAPTSPQVPQASVAGNRLPRGLPVPLDAEKTGFFFNDCGGLATRASAVSDTDSEKRVTVNSAERPESAGPQSPLFVLALMVAPLLVVVTVFLCLSL